MIEKDSGTVGGEERSMPSLLDRIARALLLGIFFVLPLFAIPSLSVPFGFSKIALFMCGTALALILWTMARLKDGKISIPSGAVLPLLAALVVASAVSVAASGALPLSWGGTWFEADSFAFFLSLAAFLFLTATLLRSADQIFYAYLLLVASAALLALFHLIRFAGGPGILSFHVWNDPSATPLGRWNDLGTFFGAVAVFLLSTLEFMKLRMALRVLLAAALLVSLLLLAAVNFTLAWVILGVFALVFLVYLISFKHLERAAYEDVRPPRSPEGEEGLPEKAETGELQNKETTEIPEKRKIPPFSFAVFLCAAVFVLFSGALGVRISKFLGVTVFEARPSFGATMDVARETLTENPLFGAGPNLFAREWLRAKPIGTNQTIFWNTNFSSGIGFLPTALITTGLVGAGLWVLFLAAYFFSGFRFILSLHTDKVSRYLVGAGFLSSLFLWLIVFFYSPGPVILALTFALTGLSLAALSAAGALPLRTLRFAENPALSFASVLALILCILGSAALFWSVGSRFASAISFTEGVRAANERNNLDEAERLISRASLRTPLDLYARTLTELMLARMNALAASTTNANAETARATFERFLGRAIGYSRDAVSLDGGNYENWLALGRVYEAVVPLKIQGAYEAAANAYGEALTRNPKSPGILLSLARLEAAKGDGAKARAFIGKSLELKPNFTEAVFFLSQIEVQEGNIKGAIQSVEAAIVFAPNDPVLRFQLGLLQYNEKNWNGAVAALEQAIALNPNYANARYFLGLSYERVNRNADAIAQFELLAKSNPDSQEVALILGNLKAGRAPFTNAAPPVDAKPEKRAELPVSEQSGKRAKKKSVVESEN